jgi:hypothetical protein
VYDEDLTNLDEWLRRLKIEYLIYFNGNRKKPPEDLRLRLERLVKKLSECSDMSFSQRFRLNTLIARYYVYRDLWRRTLLEREMGAEKKGEEAGLAESAKTTINQPSEAVRISISDPEEEKEKIQQLYDALVRLKDAGSKESPLSFQQFAKYITTRTLDIRKKQGCPRVAYIIALEEGGIRFTAVADDA